MFCRGLKFIWKVVTILLVLLGAVVTLYNLSARIAVSCDSPVYPSKVFSSPFTVENKGILPIYDIEFSCLLNNVEWQDGSVMNVRTRTKADPIKRISAGEATTIFCRPLPYKTVIKGANIEVEVKYRPAYLPWSKRASFRFGTIKGSDGSLHWIRKALSE